MRWKLAEYSGWGRALRAEGELARPERQAHLAATLAESPCPAFGAQRSYGDACLNSRGRAVLTTRLDRVLSFDPETGLFEAEAGARLGDIARLTAPRGWLPAVLPGTGLATLGGAIGNDVHGKNHHHAGSFGQHVEGFTLLGPGGETEVAPGDALFRATLGGLGQTGVITRARLRLAPCRGDVMLVTERRIADWDDFLDRLDASRASHSVGWIDATARGGSLGRGVLEEGETGAGLVPRPGRARRVPFDAPRATLSPPVVRAFNAAYWRRVPAAGRSLVKPLEEFFFPLDRIADWNRLYGKRGFHQFQCVVPLLAAPTLKTMLEKIAASRLASPLAVLKRMGPGRAGMMSFPMEGYTLAVDLAESAEARRLVARLEASVLEVGGRVYLAKDSLASPEAVRAMYPERAAWAALVNRADPGRHMVTDLVRRLDLRSAE